MTIKEFVHNFDLENPDWSHLPAHFPNCDLEGLTSSEVGRFQAISTVWEISQPEQPRSRSRTWTSSEGYKYLIAWSNAALLRHLIRLTTDALPKSEYRRKSQLDDAARSVVRNIEEGYKRATTVDYLNFIGYSQGSLEEVKGDIRELTDDGFLASRSGSWLADVGIDLGVFHQALRGTIGGYRNSKGANFLYRPLTVLYPPLAKVRAGDLTYEMFLELINKTDWNLRKLVESLEKKLRQDQKYYQVEQLRIKAKLKWK